ncbi:hypothetical protein TSOC_002273 [Tetrabaena socialis]|uniref:Uncharacterized protein n=1 Tax=Tetrabaena socialis TaxID=47790 RepID=A0A2J8AEK1_9CHLO|nr:hypothetical protein TSOC_002273 [Tetrabaena socialis]|eukprot:PNH10943.1 hypothetical protein TSOC_002273 [Tetrabaena socialis]
MRPAARTVLLLAALLGAALSPALGRPAVEDAAALLVGHERLEDTALEHQSPSGDGRALLGYAPANCDAGWTITGDCVTSTTYTPAGSSQPLEFKQRCSKSWTEDRVRKAAKAKCMDVKLFDKVFVKSNFVCCEKCTLPMRILGRCP